MRNKEMRIDNESSNEQNDQLIFEEEMMRIEEQMHQNERTVVHKKITKPKEYIDEEKKKEINSQLFGILKPENDFQIKCNAHGESTSISFQNLKEATLQFKKNAKCVFLGNFLLQCSNTRKAGDNWYFWCKEMLEGIDKNEAIMNTALLEHGHEKIERILIENGGDDWNQTLEEKLENLKEGLKSIEELIMEGGMTTVWGKIKHKGLLHTRIREAYRKGKGVRGVLSYVKYKTRKWNEHYRKVNEKMKSDYLYY